MVNSKLIDTIIRNLGRSRELANVNLRSLVVARIQESIAYFEGFAEPLFFLNVKLGEEGIDMADENISNILTTGTNALALPWSFISEVELELVFLESVLTGDTSCLVKKSPETLAFETKTGDLMEPGTPTAYALTTTGADISTSVVSPYGGVYCIQFSAIADQDYILHLRYYGKTHLKGGDTDWFVDSPAQEHIWAKYGPYAISNHATYSIFNNDMQNPQRAATFLSLALNFYQQLKFQTDSINFTNMSLNRGEGNAY